MKKKEMNEAERKYRLAQNYRHFAWRIMVYLKVNPDVLNANNNQEVFDAVREIQIQHCLKATPKYTREDAAEFVDFILGKPITFVSDQERENERFILETFISDISKKKMESYKADAECIVEWVKSGKNLIVYI